MDTPYAASDNKIHNIQYMVLTRKYTWHIIICVKGIYKTHHTVMNIVYAYMHVQLNQKVCGM